MVSFASIQRLSIAGARNERSNQTILELERTLSDLATAQQAERAYIVTNNESFLPPYAAARPSSAAHIATLRGLTAGDPAEAPRVADLAAHADAVFALLDQGIALRRSGAAKPGELGALSVSSQDALDVVRGDVAALEATEQHALETGRVSRGG